MGERAPSVIESLRQRIRTAGKLSGYPAAIINIEEAEELLSGVSAENVLRQMLQRKPGDQELVIWIRKNHPALLSKKPETAPEAKPAPKAVPAPKTEEPKPAPHAPKVETAKPAPEAKPEAKAEAPKVADPRTHAHWPVLVTAGGAMGIDMDKAMEFFVDQTQAALDRERKANADLLAALEEANRHGIPTHTADDWGVDPAYKPSKQVHLAKRLMERGKSVLMVGPLGSGKTMGFKWIGREMQRKVVFLSMHSHIQVDAIEGYSWLDVQDGVTVQKWMPGIVETALRNGWILVFDEYDRGPSAIQQLCNYIAEYHELTIKEGPLAGQTIKAEPGFLVCMTANTLNGSTGQYTANPLDTSNRSRVRIVRVDYDTDAEAALLKGFKVADVMIRQIQDAVAEARREFKQGNLVAPFGTRHIKHLAEDIRDGLTAYESWTINYSNQQSEDEQEPAWALADRIGKRIA